MTHIKVCIYVSVVCICVSEEIRIYTIATRSLRFAASYCLRHRCRPRCCHRWQCDDWAFRWKDKAIITITTMIIYIIISLWYIPHWRARMLAHYYFSPLTFFCHHSIDVKQIIHHYFLFLLLLWLIRNNVSCAICHLPNERNCCWTVYDDGYGDSSHRACSSMKTEMDVWCAKWVSCGGARAPMAAWRIQNITD